MASAWGDSWGVSWGDSWGSGVAPAPEPSPEVPIRMYGGGGFAYRPSNEDVTDLLKLLFPRRKRKRKLKAKELEAAAVAVMNMTSPPSPAVRAVIVDYVKPLLTGQARQEETRLLIEALLTKAAEAAAREAIELEQDDEDVIQALHLLN